MHKIIKKRFITLLMMAVPFMSYAQSVMGIPFGTCYERVLKTLEDRFGKHNVENDNGALKI